LDRALGYYAEAGESDRAVAIAEYPFYPMIGQRIGNDQLIARALSLVDPDSPRAGRLLSRYGRLLGLEEGDYQGRSGSVRESPGRLPQGGRPCFGDAGPG